MKAVPEMFLVGFKQIAKIHLAIINLTSCTPLGVQLHSSISRVHNSRNFFVPAVTLHLTMPTNAHNNPANDFYSHFQMLAPA